MATVFERGWKPLSAALDALGVAAFACVFGAINLQVFMRYVANHPVSWSEEFPTLAFAVAVLWAAAVTLRAADHIVFELLTDLLPRKLQLAVAALAYSGVAGIFAVAFPAIADFALYMKVLSSPILRIRYDFVFSFFAFFIGMVALRSAVAGLSSLVWLVRGGPATRSGNGADPCKVQQAPL